MSKQWSRGLLPLEQAHACKEKKVRETFLDILPMSHVTDFGVIWTNDESCRSSQENLHLELFLQLNNPDRWEVSTWSTLHLDSNTLLYAYITLPFGMLQVHFLAIWALEHHFPKLEAERSMAPFITLPGDLGTWTPLPKVGKRKKYGPFCYTSWQCGHLNTTSQRWKEKEVWSLLLHFLAIWALDHHFPKVEGETSMVPSITLPGDLGTWAPLPKGGDLGRSKKYGPFYYTSSWSGHMNTTSQNLKEEEVP